MNQDNALLLVREQDMKKRMNGGQEFINFLASPVADLTPWTNLDKIVDSLATYWVSSSNFKVALLGLDILSLLVERLQTEFQPHYNLVQNALVDRLGDQKDQVRDGSITLLTNIMDVAASPQFLFERLAPAFSHKVWRVREGVCRLLVATINRFGAKSLYLSKLLPHVCKLLGDPNGQVRDVAVQTVVEIYRHVGERVRQDLCKKGLPASKVHMLNEQFDMVLQSGDMVTASETGSVMSSTGSFESGESAGILRPSLSNVIINNNNSRSVAARNSATVVDGPVRQVSAHTTSKSIPSRPSLPSSRSSAGAVDEDSFVHDFDQNLPPVRLYGAKDLEEQLSRIQATLSDEKKDWEERIKALKVLRGLTLAGGLEFESFHHHLRVMESALQLSAKDLRSQVVRETCVTIGFLSSSVKSRFEHSACLLLPVLFTLIPNAAKVMSTSGILSIRTILKHTHGPRLIPIVTSYCTSRTTSIRRHTFAFLDIIFQHWISQLLEKHIAVLKESVQKGINDADSEAREEARRAWHGLNQHFPNEADEVFRTLNPSQQKLIKGQSFSSSSIDSSSRGDTNHITKTKSRPSLSTSGTGPRRLVSKAPPSAGLRTTGTSANSRFLRSRSDIDPSSAKRSKMKAISSGYGTTAHHGSDSHINYPVGKYKSVSGSLPVLPRTSSLPRKPASDPGGYLSDSDAGRPSRVNPRLSSTTAAKPAVTQDRGRNAARPSSSQPGSRSNSPGTQRRLQGLPRTPNSRVAKPSSYGASQEHAFAGHGTSEYDSVFRRGSARTPPSSPTPTRRSRIPVSNSRTGSRAGSRVGSRVGSRAGSPTGSRGGSPPRYRGRMISNTSTGHGVPPMRVLPKGREGEQALNDAFSRKVQRRKDAYGLPDNDDDMSDTSSVCSDRSSSYSSRNGVKKSQPTEDIVEILQLCQSGLWTERKEGLSGLQALINKQKDFSRLQLKKILEIFNRLFADPHGKVFSMFLEMLPDFLLIYKDDIHDWLYVLLTQLLKKMGADLLGSVQAKVLKALQVTRESFPTEMQFNILSRYVVDQTQRPNLKVKIALLHYMLELVGMMDASEITNTSDTRLALSRIITWTTEPKSQDMRKIAEALVISVFELNAPIFTKMIHVLPKTFQDGAMKVLYGYMKTNGDTGSSSPSDSSTGHVMGRVAVSPSRNVVSPRGSVGTFDLMSPRGSIINESENMNRDEITENFRDIAAGIQKLRMDSGTDDVGMRKHPYDHSNSSPTRGNIGISPVFSRPFFPPPLQQLQNSPKIIGARKYNPNSYSELSPSYNKHDLRDAIFDDDDSLNEEIALDQLDSNLPGIAAALPSERNKGKVLHDLSRALRNSDAVSGLAASQLQRQWDQHFNAILCGVLEILRNGDFDIRIMALNILSEMMRRLSNRFKNFAEVTVIHILEAHKDATKEVMRAAEDAGNTMCLVLPVVLCVQVLTPLTKSSNNDGVQACLKMLTSAINRCSSDELPKQTVLELVPGLLQCYDNPESGIRKAAVFCLVALHRVIGDAELCQHLTSLPGGKMKLLQLYIKRSQSDTAAGV